MDTGSIDASVQRLDDAAAAAERVVSERLELLRLMVRLQSDSGWKVSGARTAACWLKAYAGLSNTEAQRVAKMARLAARYPAFADAVFSRRLSLAQAEALVQWVTEEREPAFAEMIAVLVVQAGRLADPDDFTTVVRHWAGLVDQELAKPPRIRPHALYLSQGLFGGGEIHGNLSESCFLNVAAALEAFDSGPDPTDGPVKPRSSGERRADALDDLANFGLTHDADGEAEPDVESAEPVDEHGCTCPRANRAQRRRRARRIRRKSAATINVVIDLLTLAGRDTSDLTGIDLRSDHWRVGITAAERLLCDSGLVATLVAGRNTVLDASDRSEGFTAAQRRALAVRDRCCVFPSCDRPAHWCDAHHVHPRSEGGDDGIHNAALLCRYHHRLIHESGWELHVDRQNRWVATDRFGIEWTGEPRGHSPRPRHREPVPA